jgi:hypothetical protein
MAEVLEPCIVSPNREILNTRVVKAPGEQVMSSLLIRHGHFY